MSDSEATIQLLREVREALNQSQAESCLCGNCQRSRRIIKHIDERLSPPVSNTESAKNQDGALFGKDNPHFQP